MDANAELVTSMSHDIRTPLTVLLGYLDIMKLHAPDEEMMSYINASEKTALRLKKLSDDMFSYFLLFGGGAAEVDMQEYDARTLVDQMLSEHVLLLNEQGYNVELDMAYMTNDGLVVRTDANLLKRIVENLMSNILKYADRERPITVSGRLEEEMLVVTVENFIPEVINNADSNKIGLKTCVKLAKLMDAQLTATEADGKFTVLLKIPTKFEKDAK
jgi:signal transduction histidine kinase